MAGGPLCGAAMVHSTAEKKMLQTFYLSEDGEKVTRAESLGGVAGTNPNALGVAALSTTQ